MIVVCGEALIDKVDNGDGTERAAPGGGPFNTARALARLGVPTAYLGHLSEDAHGRELAGLLTADGASPALATSGPEPTTVAVAEVDDAAVADYRFFIQGTAAPNLTLDMVPAGFGPDVRALHVGTLGLVLEPMASTLAQLVRREFGRRLVMVDPNIRPALASDPRFRDRLEAVISRSTIVKASEADLAWLYPGLEHVAACDRITAQRVRLAIAMLGAEGAYGSTVRARVRVRAPLVRVVATIGAGDAFGAGVLAWLHNRDALRPDLRLDVEQLESLLAFACSVASLTCARAGAEPPWRSEFDQGA